MPLMLIHQKRFGDERGWFVETYNKEKFDALGVGEIFCQDNHSMSAPEGVLRGLHFQRPPHAQAKLVRCVRGAIFDVAVDVRRGSPTYGKWFGAELTSRNGDQLFVPIGFAHGFVTLEPDTEVEYKVTAFYAPKAEDGIIWNDVDVGISWPIGKKSPTLSSKDEKLPRLSALESPFSYDGRPAELLELQG